MRTQKTIPPRSAERLLHWLCKKELLDEILGDLHEYYKESAEKPWWIRKIQYWFHVFNFLRPFAIKNLGGDYKLNQFGVFKNYYKTSIRNLIKNPLSSFINISGLTAAISVCITAYVFLKWDDSRDQFHRNKNELYLVTFFAETNGKNQQHGTSPAQLAKMLKQDFQQIDKVCRLKDRNAILKCNGKVFHDRIRYADHEFLEMFTFPLKWGSPHSLADVRNIILSEEMSIKHFGYENPIGQSISVIFDHGKKQTFKVSGVAEAFPKAHEVDFEFLVNFENLYVSEFDFNSQESMIDATFIQVADQSKIPVVEKGMGKYVNLLNDTPNALSISSFSLVPLTELHQRSGDIIGDISFEFPPQKVVLPLLGILLLLIACLNYINIAITSATRRLKEIGLRKSIGASRRQIVLQFLTENLIITFFALSIGVLVSASIIIPWLNQAFELNLSLKISSVDSSLLIYMFLISLFCSLISGLYPALYISRFRVANIFTGSVQFGRKNSLTKIFLVIQLVLTCIGFACGIAVYQNVGYIEDRSWGYNQSETLYLKVPDQSTINQFLSVLEQDSYVLASARSTHHLGKSNGSARVYMPEHQYEVNLLSVDSNYLNTMGLHLLAGRFLENDRGAIVVNELFVKQLALKQPIGQQLKIDNENYEVIGVVEDFHFYNFDYEMQPSIFQMADSKNYRYLSVRVVEGSKQKTLKSLQAQWLELYPELPFTGGFQEDVFGAYNEGASNGAGFILWIAIISMILICLGLYGLMTFNLAGRVKEFSIRKVLGAQLTDVATAITRPYTFLFATALIIGIPTSYIISTSFLDSLYVYYDPISFVEVSVSALILVLISLSVIAIQIQKISRWNPADGLKTE